VCCAGWPRPDAMPAAFCCSILVAGPIFGVSTFARRPRAWLTSFSTERGAHHLGASAPLPKLPPCRAGDERRYYCVV
jgi:hypothetical protein